MDPLRILVTGAGAPGYAAIVNCLRYNGERALYIVGVDMNAKASGRSLTDAFYQVPPAADPGFIPALLKIAEEERIDVVIPIVTRELELFSAAREAFSEIGTKVCVMDPGPLHTANNKGLLLDAMKEAGLPVPAYKVVRTAEELENAVYEMGYPGQPVVVKPTFGNGSRGTRIIDPGKSRFDLMFQEKPNSMYMSFQELISVIHEKDAIPEMMVMEYLPGKEICVDALAEHGKVRYISSREGVAVNSIQIISRVTWHEEAISLASQVIGLLKLDGNVNFDIRPDREGRVRVLEINPRLPAGIAAQAAAGINFPYLGIKQLLGEALPELTASLGHEMQFRNEAVLYRPSGEQMAWDEIRKDSV